MWNVSDAFLAFALIALVIGVVLLLTYVLSDVCESENERVNLHKSSLLLLLAVALAVLTVVFQRKEAAEFVRSML